MNKFRFAQIDPRNRRKSKIGIQAFKKIGLSTGQAFETPVKDAQPTGIQQNQIHSLNKNGSTL